MLAILSQRQGLHDLAERVRAIENRPAGQAQEGDTRGVPTGWGVAWGPARAASEGESVQGQTGAPGLLARGVVHEWFGPVDAPDAARGRGGQSVWSPPLCIFAHLARRSLVDAQSGGSDGWVVWIGRRCWAYPRVLAGGRDTDGALLDRSVFTDPPDDGGRLWAIELALRCRAVTAVIADGRGVDMAGSRRLQLAAKAGRALCLVARPAEEMRELSAAATRWLVRRAPSPGESAKESGEAGEGGPRWIVELLRCKGVRPVAGALRPVIVEWDHAQGAVVVPADVVRRAGGATDEGERGRTRRTA